MIDLRPHNDPAHLMEEAKDWAATCSQLREENARLREALVKIAKRDWYPVPSEIANEALNKEPTP